MPQLIIEYFLALKLREFTHRFHKQLKLAKTHLDALNTFDPITEPTCKAIAIGLLDIIHSDEQSAVSKQVRDPYFFNRHFS